MTQAIAVCLAGFGGEQASQKAQNAFNQFMKELEGKKDMDIAGFFKKLAGA